MRQTFFVNLAKSVDGRVGIRGGLEVGEEVAAIAVAEPHARDALVDLAEYACAGQTATGAEAAIVTERAAADGYGAVDVRTGEPSIDTDFLYTAAKMLAQMEVAGEIGQAGLTPFEPWVGGFRFPCRKWFG